jgi:hypothetical protein
MGEKTQHVRKGHTGDYVGLYDCARDNSSYGFYRDLSWAQVNPVVYGEITTTLKQNPSQVSAWRTTCFEGWAYFAKESEPKGNEVRKEQRNLGLPKAGNRYGDGASIVEVSIEIGQRSE